MFDIGWSEFLVIAVVALIAIGPKELPGVLRMVGQWMGKARKMAAEFQGQFQEAMREAEMADLKKSFDEVKEAASGFSGGNIMSSLQKDVSESLRIDDLDKPAISSDTPAISTDTPAISNADTPAISNADTPAISNADTPAISNADTPAVLEAAHPGIDLPAHPTTPEAPTPATFAEADAHAVATEPVAKDAKAS
jgi:sec-independent protein translocase protein TatB